MNFIFNPRSKIPSKDLHHCLTEKSIHRLMRFPAFNGGLYLQHNPDVEQSGIDPYVHFLSDGFREFRVQDMPHIARAVGQASRAPLKIDPTPEVSLSGKKIEVLCSSLGNAFMRILAEHLVHGLMRCGADATLHDDRSRPEDSPDFRIIVAPHEFFHDGRGEFWMNTETLSRTVMLSTEQIQTQWYWSSLPYLLIARGVIDLFPFSKTLLAEAGVPSVYYAPDLSQKSVLSVNQISQHPLFSALPVEAQQSSDPSTSLNNRVIDVAFFASSSTHRDKLLARLAPFLSALESFIYYRRINRGPLENQDSLLTPLAEHVSSHSKICLNIHRDQFGPFEWHRMVELGMCSGAVVVSEPCLSVPGIVAGEHYLEADSRNLGEMIEWLLRERDGQILAAHIRQNASSMLSKNYASNTSARHVAAFLTALP